MKGCNNIIPECQETLSLPQPRRCKHKVVQILCQLSHGPNGKI